MSDDDRFKAAVMMLVAAMQVFHSQGYNILAMVEHVEKEVFTPGGELYKEANATR